MERKTIFFVLLSFAAWSSAISLIEPAVAWLVENRGWDRLKASILAGLITWVVGVGTVLSFNEWSEIKLFDKTFFDLLDYLTANIMLPLGGLFIAIFVAWIMGRASSLDELEMGDHAGFKSWYFLVRFVTPLAVVVVFLKAIGVI